MEPASFEHIIADWLAARVPSDQAEVIRRIARRLAQARSDGHSCLDLATVAGGDDGEGGRFPALVALTTMLATSGIVGDGREPTFLVQDDTRLYLYRYWAAERRVAQRLRALLALGDSEPDAAALARLSALFPTQLDQSSSTSGLAALDWQAIAALAALRRRLAVVVGGPGTGKTTTVVKILACLLASQPDLRIAVAAPTGKAAQRLKEAMSQGVERVRSWLPSHDAVTLTEAAQQAATIHRLLGYHGGEERFRHRAGSPLRCDVLVVDEASMVDLLLFDALLAALPDHARLIVLGDAGQLTSVETGVVLGDVHHAAERTAGFSPALVASARMHVGMELPVDPAASSLRDSVVELRHSHRFDDSKAIGRLAAAVRAGQGEAAWAMMLASADVADDSVCLVPDLDAALAHAVPAYRLAAHAADPHTALRALDRMRVLAALRSGEWGVEGLNRRIARALGHGLGPHHGSPLIITANAPDLGLANGDIGVWWRTDQGLRAFFPGMADGFAAARLPDHDAAWALTVHKSQGSEYDRVVLVLPPTPSPVLCRQLVYTGLTRVRHGAVVCAERAVFIAAVADAAARMSGLEAALLA
jgi:exodeoxyribonuclease V alpha subunit